MSVSSPTSVPVRERLRRLTESGGVDAVARDGLATSVAFNLGVRAAVRRALDRLDDGSYGQCDACAASIAPARLEAVPYARRCEPCQDAAEAAWRGVDAMLGQRVRALGAEPQGPMGARRG